MNKKPTLFIVVLLLFSLTLSAQTIVEYCPNENTNGTIVNFTSYQDTIYATGFFNKICGESIDYIAKWDGLNWLPVGEGLSDPGHALTVINNQLFAAKYEESIDSNWVYVLEGNSWNKFGEGVYLTTASGFSSLPNIYDIIEFNGQIIACGEFDRVGNQEISGIMAWNGTNWTELGGGISGPISNNAPVMFPHQLFVFEEDLYIIGNFKNAGTEIVNGIARWDGDQWHAMGAGFDNTVYGIGAYNGELYVGGAFTMSGSTSLDRIAKWNGSEWTSLGFGFIPSNQNDFIFVHTITEIDDQLFLAGGLKRIEYEDGTTIDCGGVIAFDGVEINTFNGGVANNDIEAIAKLDENRIMVGGGVFNSGYLGEINLATTLMTINKKPVVVFPNPTTTEIYLQNIPNDQLGQLRIFDRKGNEVYHNKYFTPTQSLKLDQLGAGIYYLSFTTDHTVYTGEIIKQ